MIKKILLSFAMFGFVFGSPILANAQSFTNLKAQLFDLSSKIENFKLENKEKILGEVLGFTSAPSINFTATPTEVAIGGATTLNWSVINATTCYARHHIADGVFRGNKPLSGSQTLTNIQESQFVSLDCSGPGGATTVFVYIKIKNNGPTINLAFSPSKVKYGGSSTLTWSSPDAVSCYMSLGGENISATSGSLVFSNIKEDTYRAISCYNSNNKTNVVGASVTIENGGPSMSLTASPIKVPYGGSTKLKWETADAKSCEARSVPYNSTWFNYSKPLNGVQTISGLKESTTFYLYCVGYLNSYTVNVPVIVYIDDKDKTDFPGPTGDTKGDTERISTNTGTGSNICSFVFTKDLAYGSTDSVKNKDVSLMQSVLVDEGFLSSRDASGKFYSITQTALKKFQKKYNLSQTGKVDQKTRVKLNELFPVYCNQ